MLAASIRCVAPLAAPANGRSGSDDDTRGVGADMTTRTSLCWLVLTGATSLSDGSEGSVGFEGAELLLSSGGGGGCPHTGVQSEPEDSGLYMCVALGSGSAGSTYKQPQVSEPNNVPHLPAAIHQSNSDIGRDHRRPCVAMQS